MLNYSDENLNIFLVNFIKKGSRDTHGRGLMDKVSDMNKEEIERNEY